MMTLENLCIFEDYAYQHFLPLTFTRATFELKCGISTLEEKIRYCFPAKRTFYLCRDYLKDVVKQRNTEVLVNDLTALQESPCLFINGRTLFTKSSVDQIILNGKERVYLANGQIAAVFLSSSSMRQATQLLHKPWGDEMTNFLKQKPIEEVSITMVSFPWDLIKENPECLIEDWKQSIQPNIKPYSNQDSKIAVYGDVNKIIIGENSTIDAWSVLDSREGPISIGKNVKIHSHVTIKGPVHIGDDSIVFEGARIYEGTSCGAVCRLGGEIEGSIIHGYSNKRHEGFLGHAYLGEWINVGAFSTNSDLKDTYGVIKMWVAGQKRSSGRMTMGCFIGDHSKLSIGTLVYTGKTAGVATHLHGIVTEDVPSFCIWTKSLGTPLTELYLDSALETARRMYSRRNREVTIEEAAVLKHVFEITAEDRKKLGVGQQKFTW